jgi:hypothetical protein
MYRKSDWVELGFLGLAFVLLYGGTRLSLPILSNLGSACIGAFGLVAGIDAIRSGHVGFETRRKNFGRISSYTGLSARLIGILFIAFALMTFGLTGMAMFYQGGAGAFWSNLFSNSWGWGIILSAVGLAVSLIGFIQLSAGSAGYYKGLADKVERIGGIFPLLFGLVMIVLGMLLIFLPGVLLDLWNQALAVILGRFSR